MPTQTTKKVDNSFFAKLKRARSSSAIDLLMQSFKVGATNAKTIRRRRVAVMAKMESFTKKVSKAK